MYVWCTCVVLTAYRLKVTALHDDLCDTYQVQLNVCRVITMCTILQIGGMHTKTETVGDLAQVDALVPRLMTPQMISWLPTIHPSWL